MMSTRKPKRKRIGNKVEGFTKRSNQLLKTKNDFEATLGLFVAASKKIHDETDVVLRN